MDKKMKKNKAMRAAGGLFVATMLTTSIVSGTYAKYVTSDKAGDNARVAVFGVKVEAGGELFAQTYVNKGNGNTPAGDGAVDNTITVRSSADYVSTADNLTKKGDLNNVVAPGTKSSEQGMTLSISGTPEVDVDVVFTFRKTSDVWLGQSGTYYYPDMTNGDVFDNTFEESDVFQVTDAYYPVQFKLENNNGDLVGGESRIAGTLANVQDYIIGQLTNGRTVNTDYTITKDENETKIIVHIKAGTDLSTLELSDLKLTWEWDFDDEERGTYDKHDTLLGDLAAYKFGGNNLVQDAMNAINNAEIDKSEGKQLIDELKDNNSAPVNNNNTTGYYNLIANLDFDITVTQVD